MGLSVNLAEDVPSVIELSTAIFGNLSWALCSAVGGISTMHFKSSYSIFRALVGILFGINKPSTEAVSGVSSCMKVTARVKYQNQARLGQMERHSKARVRQNMLIKNRCNRHRLFDPVRNIDAQSALHVRTAS